jgi:hypothetical protein
MGGVIANRLSGLNVAGRNGRNKERLGGRKCGAEAGGAGVSGP